MATDGTIGVPFQPGNKAAVGHGPPMKHGLASKRRRFTIGKLPKGCSWINTLVSTLRRELEALTLQVHGMLGPKEELFIQSACRHEQAALLAQRWLRLKGDTMTHGERLQYLQAIAAESDKRDKCVERLKLDIDAKSVLESLYAPQTPSHRNDDSEDRSKQADSPEGPTGD